MNKNKFLFLLIFFIILLAFSCSEPLGTISQPTYTHYPTYTKYPTYTLYPPYTKDSTIAVTNSPIKTQQGKKLISDLSYIKIIPSPYSDDADPEYEGVAIDIDYYDSKSEPIMFEGVPLEVEIEFIGHKDAMASLDKKQGEVVYKVTSSIDHSMRLEEMFGKYIRISFIDINVDPLKCYQYGSVRATVITPSQGSFVAESDFPVQLYP